MKKIDFNQVYELDDPLANQPLRIDPPDELTKKQAIGLFNGSYKPKNSIIFHTAMGGRSMDILWSRLTPLLVVSDRIVKLFKDNKITGWNTYPVKVHDHEGKLLKGYHGFVVTGRTGKVDIKPSEIITKPTPAPKGRPYKVYKGIYFDASKWDGSDVFKPSDSNRIYILEPVVKLLNKEKIRNNRLTKTTEAEANVSDFEILGIGR